MTPERAEAEAQAKLEEYRLLIDDVDRRIVALLNERTAVVEDIGRVKREAHAGRARLLRAHYRRQPLHPASAHDAKTPGGTQMLVVMQEGATEEQIEHVIDRLVDLEFDVHRSTGVIHTV